MPDPIIETATPTAQPAKPPAPKLNPPKGPPKLYLGILCYGAQVYVEWMNAVIATLTKTQLISQIGTIGGDSLVCRARNNLAATFLAVAKDCTHLLFIDCDIVFEPWMIQRLISHDKPVVCGMYPLKRTVPGWVVNNVPGADMQSNGLVQVREAGTGFMLIRRDVLEAMAAAHPEIAYLPDDNENGGHPRYDFFSVGPYRDRVVDRVRYLSEDYYFCQRWRDMGGDIWLDTKVRAKHIGRAIYPLAEEDLRNAVFAYDVARKAEANDKPTAKL
jgi:hypothetical protein